ncbi:hypothetical protein PV11_00585 [Exophiala sideris]|uniref:Uncharacterized protein n=1 Tax=Exophiala sideris TaxID=1016849 RepID=A0A0D1XAD5_9EURO|nr:hypothetical protein PV11_00585 [Exophiala sideris]
MAQSPEPLLVGIDVGMTCTGVAYIKNSAAIEMTEPRTIQKWPGNGAGKADKVPTSLCYEPGNEISWGFLTHREDGDDLEVHDWFKIYLDETEYHEAAKLSPETVPPTHAHVKAYYRDYLRKLYQHIRKVLSAELPAVGFEEETIEFIFSVPTTWSPGVAEDLRQLAREAGFDSGGSNHSVKIGLTEAEAAAVCSFSTQSGWFANGDVMLIVDAGGGTTDLALLKSEVVEGARPTLKQLDEVRGDEIGSVEIDIAFSLLAEARLQQAAPYIDLDRETIPKVVNKMARTTFKVIKEEYGNEDHQHLPVRNIPIPGISVRACSDAGDVQKGKLTVPRSDVQAMFDVQLEKMYRLVDAQLNRMQAVAPHDQVKYLVLSGGLGSSEYVKKKLEDRYIREKVNLYAPHLRIITSNHPNLAVVKGLLIDRMQKLKFDKSVLRVRKCRQSLGIICDQPYDKTRVAHQRARLRADILDGKTYATEQISWFVRQGELLESDIVEHSFFRNIAKNKPRTPFHSQIAICYSAGALPNSMQEDGAELCYVMTSDLSRVDLKRFRKIKKHWWEFKKPPSYYEAKYNIRFCLNAANIECELWFDDRKYNEPNSSQVQFESGMWTQRPKQHRSGSRDRGIPDSR